MKTSAEWAHVIVSWDNTWHSLIEEIQLDAYKQGMTDAADLIASTEDRDIKSNRQRILDARDKVVTL